MKPVIDKPLASFFVYASSKHFFHVEICRSRRHMRTYLRGEYGITVPVRAMALTTHWVWKKPTKAEARWIGNMFYVGPEVTAGVIAHECTHAMLFWARAAWNLESQMVSFGNEQTRDGRMSGREEQAAGIVETLVDQTVTAMGQRRLAVQRQA